MKNKQGLPTYSLVCEEPIGGQLYYYTGRFLPIDTDTILTQWYPENTTDYTMALKMSFRDEAEDLCKKISVNISKFSMKYKVEEHMYM
jgi:hypothetical protein